MKLAGLNLGDMDFDIWFNATYQDSLELDPSKEKERGSNRTLAGRGEKGCHIESDDVPRGRHMTSNYVVCVQRIDPNLSTQAGYAWLYNEEKSVCYQRPF
jgi:hypothetical protein